MLFYILKSSICLAALMLFYKLCLEKTTVHHFKRFYLIAVILISIGIPLITFTQYVEAKPVNITSAHVATNIAESKIFQDYIPITLWSIYALGVVLFSFRFLKNLYRLFYKIKVNPKCKNQNYINVLLRDLIHPHTFFKYIFLNKTRYEHNLIPQEVLLHEQVHVKQQHTLDILFMEMLQILFWFNPLIYLIKKDIKLNHEFLADREVINRGYSTTTYQQILLAFSSNAPQYKLANAINYSLIKKRFTVMKTKTSKTVFWLRSLIILPLLAILVYGFSGKTIIERETASVTKAIQQKATPEQVDEYNALAKKYNNMPKDHFVVKNGEVERLKYLYGIMSAEQRKNAEPFPEFPPPPPAPEAPNAVGAEIPSPPPPPEVPNVEDREIPSPPPPPEVPKVEGVDIPSPPPPPPPPKSPLEHVIEMAKKGATFYFNGKKVSSDKAIALMKKNSRLNISTNTNDGVSVVKIETKPVKN